MNERVPDYMRKKETFKYKFLNIIRHPIKRLLDFHKKLLVTSEQDVANVSFLPRSAYQVIIDNTSETLQYGACITFVMLTLFKLTGWLQLLCFPICFGLLRWLFLDLVENTSKSIKGK